LDEINSYANTRKKSQVLEQDTAPSARTPYSLHMLYSDRISESDALWLDFEAQYGKPLD